MRGEDHGRVVTLAIKKHGCPSGLQLSTAPRTPSKRLTWKLSKSGPARAWNLGSLARRPIRATASVRRKRPARDNVIRADAGEPLYKWGEAMNVRVRLQCLERRAGRMLPNQLSEPDFFARIEAHAACLGGEGPRPRDPPCPLNCDPAM
jgi:hypothetical protein